MRSMTFLVNDSSIASGPAPAVSVTITENGDGTVSFSIASIGGTTGDLRGFFFDVANESRLGSLSVVPISPGFTEFQQGNDSIKDLGNGANMQGLLGSDGGYDAGVEIGSAGTGKDDYQSFSFTLKSSTGALTLDDFANVDIGVRLNSVGVAGGSRNGEAKLLEHTTSAIDARDDAGAVTEDAAVNQVTGNVFANDVNVAAVHVVTAVNGAATNVGSDIQGTYGTLRVALDGSYTYTLDNSRAALQALADGQHVVENFSYSAKSSDEASSSSSDSASILITVTGTNDAPTVTAAVSSGAVDELANGSPDEGIAILSATGSIDFSDVDLTDAHSVVVSPTPADYLGSLTATVVNPSTGDGTGQVQWVFQVSDAALDHLAAGEKVTQTYAVSVSDGHGGSASQDVTITINGTNDAPEIVGGDSSGEVSEDGSLRDSGQLVALDVDEHSTLSWSATGAGPGTPYADYRFLLDNLNVVRNGQQFFNDDFSNGTPPPAGPIATPNPGYFTTGTFAESGGKLIFDGLLGVPGTGGVIVNLATLNSDVGTDPSQGLKRGQDFQVEGRFDLIVPTGDLGTYGVRVSDNGLPGGGDDIIEVAVRRLADHSLAVVLRETSVVGAAPITLASIAINPPDTEESQIVLRLNHAANTDVVSASFDLVNDGMVVSSQHFGPVGHIFNNESVTRVAVIGFSPALVQNGVYGNLSVQADGQWHYALNDGAANVQALAQGEHVTDVFEVKVTDEHGASALQTVSVDVAGSNDAPQFSNLSSTFGGVQEDFNSFASGQLVATDPDHGAVVSFAPADQRGTYGTLSVQPGGHWTYALDSEASQVQALAQNQSTTDLFTVRATDEHGLSAFRTVNINVSGSNDPVVITGGVFNGEVTEDAAPIASGLVSFADPDLIDAHTAESSFLGTTSPGSAPLGTFRLLPAAESPATADGSVVWTYELSDAANFLTAGQTVTESYLVTIRDPAFGGPVGPLPTFPAQQLVTVTIHGTDDANQGPEAVPSLFLAQEDALFNGTLFATGGENLTFSLASGAQHGSAVVLPDGTFQYVPVEDFSGTDSFEFRVSNGHEQDTAPVTIDVRAVPDEPTLNVQATVVTNENQPVGLGIFAALNDNDGSESLSIEFSGVIFGSLSAGTNFGAGIWRVTPDQLPALMFIPAPGSDQDVLLQVQALATESSTGEQASAFGTIAITVNDIPAPPENHEVTEDSQLHAFGQAHILDPIAGLISRYQLNPIDAFAGDYQFKIDEFTLTRTRPGEPVVTLLHDTFDDNTAPPSSPLYANGVAAGYITRGFFSEFGDRAVMDGAVAQTTFGFGAQTAVVTNSATALTSSSATDLANGLRPTYMFDVKGVFDLIEPERVGQGYGISLSDSLNAFGGDDNIQLLVQRDPSGTVMVVLREADAPANSITLIDSFALGTIHDGEQIVLGLAHDPALTGTVVGTFQLLDHGVASQPQTFARTGQIFGTETPGFAGDDENFTRATFFSTSPANTTLHTGTYGTLALDADTGRWEYNLNNNDPDLLALSNGMSATDSFQFIGTNPFVGSFPGTIDVIVHGADEGNTPPVINGTPNSDTLVGTPGNDILSGNAGSDRLTGGAGADIFDYNNLTDQTDRITDFTPGQDRLDLHDLLAGLGSAYVPGVSNPADFVHFLQATPPAPPAPPAPPLTTVLVDPDGIAGGPSIAIAQLEGVVGLQYSDLIF